MRIYFNFPIFTSNCIVHHQHLLTAIIVTVGNRAILLALCLCRFHFAVFPGFYPYPSATAPCPLNGQLMPPIVVTSSCYPSCPIVFKSSWFSASLNCITSGTDKDTPFNGFSSSSFKTCQTLMSNRACPLPHLTSIIRFK